MASNPKAETSSTKPTQKKASPNAFVSLPITSEKVRDKLINIQKLMIEKDSALQNIDVRPGTFHLTLLVIRMDMEPSDTSAKDTGSRSHLEMTEGAMERCCKEIGPMLSELDFQFKLDKVDNFDSAVAFVSMANKNEVDAFQRAAARVREIFAEYGLHSTENRPAFPHVTLFKPTRGHYNIKINPETYTTLSPEEVDCGTETFPCLHLCSMSHPKQESGYYHIIHEKRLMDAQLS